MGKRSNGEGTIYKRKDGKWCASRYVVMEDGTCKRKYVYGKTQKAVKDKLKELENYKLKTKPDVLTLQEWMLKWLEEYKKGTLKQTTYESYLLNIKTHICGSSIGNVEVRKLSTDLLQKFYNEKLQGVDGNKPLSRRSVEYLRTIIGGSLRQAYKNELISKNINEFTVLPRKQAKEIIPLTVEELHKVLLTAKGTDMYTLLVLEAFTGMRKGEILGLQWKNIDFDKKLLYVRTNLCRIQNPDDKDRKKTILVLMEPKSRKSNRTIPLSDEVIRALKIHKKEQAIQKMRYRDIYTDNDIVFAKPDGSFEDPRLLLDKFYKILDKAGVRRCRFHDLRHTFASVLLNEGESMKVIQELLGHSSITTTMDIYSHVADETKEKSIEILEKAVKII